MDQVSQVLDRRMAGVLLHITSLPPEPYVGKLGCSARRFVDFLVDSGIRVWQMLPLGPTHSDNSPYQSLSVRAGNPALISIDWLVTNGWLQGKQAADLPADDAPARLSLLRKLILNSRNAQVQQQFEAFCHEQGNWLQAYGEFMLLRGMHGNKCWSEWPVTYRDRQTKAMTALRQQHADELELYAFEQFLFHVQWLDLKHYANRHGVLLFGDVPIFVSYDSVDVWASREQFDLNARGEMDFIAGVPPDYFSANGQRWGNPHYNWKYMQQDGFQWWVQRFTTQLELFDLIRVDHFRGFEAYWAVPIHEETAINGQWIKAPGRALFQALRERFGSLPLVAEDLGIITDEVNALRCDFGLPGMKILQFAFDSDAVNPYLPHNHEINSVVYTGTHDNDTTMGWLDKLDEPQRQRIADYYHHPRDALPWVMIQSALASVARLAVVPMQDLLLLGSEHRMNTPGTTSGNWMWTLKWEQIPPELPARFHRLVHRYGRG